MIVYLDVLIVKEMIVNYIIIFLTGKLTATKSSKRLLASFFATIYTICCFIEPKFTYPIYKMLCVITVISISLKPESISDLLKKGITFYFVTFFVAGIVSYKNDIAMQTIYLLSTVVIIAKFIKLYREKHILQNYFCIVEVPKLDIKIKALIDSGHFLKGDLGEEVIVVSAEKYFDFRGKGKEVSIKYKTIDKNVPAVKGIKIENVLIKYSKEVYKYNEVIFIKSYSSFKNYDALVSMRFLNLEKECEDKNGNYVFN